MKNITIFFFILTLSTLYACTNDNEDAISEKNWTNAVLVKQVDCEWRLDIEFNNEVGTYLPSQATETDFKNFVNNIPELHNLTSYKVQVKVKPTGQLRGMFCQCCRAAANEVEFFEIRKR
jgi:hypothetical protein